MLVTMLSHNFSPKLLDTMLVILLVTMLVTTSKKSVQKRMFLGINVSLLIK